MCVHTAKVYSAVRSKSRMIIEQSEKSLHIMWTNVIVAKGLYITQFDFENSQNQNNNYSSRYSGHESKRGFGVLIACYILQKELAI